MKHHSQENSYLNHKAGKGKKGTIVYDCGTKADTVTAIIEKSLSSAQSSHRELP
jgi:hypothetical protein